MGFRVRGLGLGYGVLGFRVQGSGFGVWSLEVLEAQSAKSRLYCCHRIVIGSYFWE